MIKSVEVTNNLNESILIELRFPEKSGFLIKEITGLGPAKADINSTEVSTFDGAIFNSARINSRNIVLTLKLLMSPTVEDIRQKSYKYFPVKKKIKLKIETDNRICEIYGYVESNEPNIFSKEENTVISIICPDPYFYNSAIETTMFSGIQAGFEFPFSNESLTAKTIVMGDIILNQEKSILYEGDSEMGVIIYIHALGAATNVTICNTQTRELMKIDTDKLTILTGSAIIAGDEIFISTIKGDKFIQLLRDGVYYNILNCLDKNVDWFQLVKGDNLFAFTAETGVSMLQFEIQNRIAYEGV